MLMILMQIMDVWGEGGEMIHLAFAQLNNLHYRNHAS
jgi:hypothetical protein